MYTPCEAGGTCEEHDGTFTCYCRYVLYCKKYSEKGKHFFFSSDRSGKYCEKAKQVQEAGFSGKNK